MEEQILNEVKFESRKLVIPTPKGDIIVTVKTDNLYPGVYVDFVSDYIKESSIISEENGKPLLQLAMVEYNTVDKELSSYVWGEKGKEDYSYKAIHNDSLMFNEDFEILPEGTKVVHNGKLGYIMGDDRDNCPEGYHSSLNYYIKYAIDEESYEDVQKRINSEDSPWYDFMDIWDSVEVVSSLS